MNVPPPPKPTFTQGCGILVALLALYTILFLVLGTIVSELISR